MSSDVQTAVLAQCFDLGVFDGLRSSRKILKPGAMTASRPHPTHIAFPSSSLHVGSGACACPSGSCDVLQVKHEPSAELASESAVVEDELRRSSTVAVRAPRKSTRASITNITGLRASKAAIDTRSSKCVALPHACCSPHTGHRLTPRWMVADGGGA